MDQLNKRPRIFITQPVAISAIERLQQVADVIVNPDSSQIIRREALLEGVRNCDYLFALMHDKIDSAVIGANARLRGIGSMAVTPTDIDIAEATRRGIAVTIVPPLVTEATAEICFGLMLAVARRIVESDRLVRSGVYPGGQSNHMLGVGLLGKTLGLIGGGGRIGRSVARRARGFQMRVVYWSPRRKPEGIEKEADMAFVPLDELLQMSDFVSVHSPLKPETRHQISERELTLMKSSAFLINTARGPIVDEQALVKALQTRQIAGAGLDVFEHEPLIAPALLNLPNVVLTPHLGSAVPETRSALANAVADNLLALIHGQRPPNIANPEVLDGKVVSPN